MSRLLKQLHLLIEEDIVQLQVTVQNRVIMQKLKAGAVIGCRPWEYM